MASVLQAAVDECAVCHKNITDPRILHCDHYFCLKCLNKIEEDNGEITCPVCRAKTTLEMGFSPKYLPKHISKKSEPFKLLKVWTVDYRINDIVMDEEAQLTYAGMVEKKPIEIYSYEGRAVGSISGSKKLKENTTLAMDTRRQLLLATYGKGILCFNNDREVAGVIECPEFKYLDGITYDVSQDKYIVTDRKARSIMFVGPDTHNVIRTLPAEEKGKMLLDTNIVRIASDKSEKRSTFITTDWSSSAVDLYDGDGLHTRGYKDKGSEYGQFYHPRGACFNPEGKAIISDCKNNRLVCLNPASPRVHEQWSVLMDTKQHQLEHPRAIDITCDGIMAVAFWEAKKGPSQLAIFVPTN